MSKKQRIVKRTLVKEFKRPADSVGGDRANQSDVPDCTGTPVVYCNQWECYSHDLCLSGSSRAAKKAMISEKK